VQKMPIMLNAFLVISCCALHRRFLTSTGIQRDLITATAAISGLASFMFGFLTNLPVALA
jgi:AGZA family xanthine/uracil permease-like MFS transporter